MITPSFGLRAPHRAPADRRSRGLWTFCLVAFFGVTVFSSGLSGAVVGLRVDPGLAEVEAKLEVVLTEIPNLRLVNRGRMGDVAEELNLGRAGLKATGAGQLAGAVGADWLVWMEPAERGNIGWRILETASGIWVSAGEVPEASLDEAFLRGVFADLLVSGGGGEKDLRLIAVAPLTGADGQPDALSGAFESALIRRLTAEVAVRAIHRGIYDEMVFERTLGRETRQLLEGARLWEGTILEESGRLSVRMGSRSADGWVEAAARGSVEEIPGMVEVLVRTLLMGDGVDASPVAEGRILRERIRWLGRAGAYLEAFRLAEMLAEIAPGRNSNRVRLEAGSRMMRQEYRGIGYSEWLGVMRHVSRLERELKAAIAGRSEQSPEWLANLPPPDDRFIASAVGIAAREGYPDVSAGLHGIVEQQIELVKTYPLNEYKMGLLRNARRQLAAERTRTVDGWVRLILEEGFNLSNAPDGIEDEIFEVLRVRLGNEKDLRLRLRLSEQLRVATQSSPELRAEAWGVFVDTLDELVGAIEAGRYPETILIGPLKTVVERREKTPVLQERTPSIRQYLLPFADRLKILEAFWSNRWWEELEPGDEAVLAEGVRRLRAGEVPEGTRAARELEQFARDLEYRFPGVLAESVAGPGVVPVRILTLGDLAMGEPLWGSRYSRRFEPTKLSGVGYTPGRLWMSEGRMVFEIEIPAFWPRRVWTVPGKELAGVRLTGFHADERYLFLFHEERVKGEGTEAWIDRIDRESGTSERFRNHLTGPGRGLDRSRLDGAVWLRGTDRVIFVPFGMDRSGRADLDLVSGLAAFEKGSLSGRNLILGSRRPPESPMDAPGHAYDVSRWTKEGEVWVMAVRSARGANGYSHAWNPQTGDWRKLSGGEFREMRDDRWRLFSERLMEAARGWTGGRKVVVVRDQESSEAVTGLAFVEPGPTRGDEVPVVRLRGAVEPEQVEAWLGMLLREGATDADREDIRQRVNQAWVRGRNFRVMAVPEGLVVESRSGGHDFMVGFVDAGVLGALR